MLDGMTKEHKTGTAVMGNLNLKQGQRTIILEILYPSMKYHQESVAVVMVGSLKISITWFSLCKYSSLYLWFLDFSSTENLFLYLGFTQ